VAEQLALDERLGIAAQLMATNGLFRRLESSWMVRATSSLPVPLSP
jgi:hypothetical protein